MLWLSPVSGKEHLETYWIPLNRDYAKFLQLKVSACHLVQYPNATCTVDADSSSRLEYIEVSFERKTSQQNLWLAKLKDKEFWIDTYN